MSREFTLKHRMPLHVLTLSAKYQKISEKERRQKYKTKYEREFS